MVGSHDPRDPLFDPIDAPDPKLLSDFELDAAASADAKLSAQGDLAATEYVERAKTEQKLRRSRREAEEAAAAARFEEQQSNTNEQEQFSEFPDFSELDEEIGKIERSMKSDAEKEIEESIVHCLHPDCNKRLLECSEHSVKIDR